eukprot:CAMPEP_0184742932 /NCGR_PEP_ID=MMETSP0315-20130426/5870_1 /TAXON_ID=101924 /ORGANISM="Rhodosorus marinus, Strain UTEX LB 2760" /LENGTH=171 /DNA_ID=CAMNT_0027214011 /DNA_START=133 /DNA_END=647 /DNA_ORIENTATION=+
MATFEEHRLFLSVAGSVLTALGALYTYEHRKFQQHELEKKIASLEEEHQYHHASGRFHRIKVTTKVAFPMITVAGIIGYVVGFRTGHAAGARRQASDVVAGKRALQKLEGGAVTEDTCRKSSSSTQPDPKTSTRETQKSTEERAGWGSNASNDSCDICKESSSMIPDGFTG